MSIKLDQASVRIGNKTLLSNISVELKPGELCGVLGENGAGKSTLLRVMAGIQAATGECLINGQKFAAMEALELASQRAVLPQETELSFPLEVIEVVRLATSFASLSINEETTLLYECLKLFAVEHLARRDYRTLSGGEKQRVQLARVIAQLRCHQADTNAAQFLLLDEPIAALDLHQQLATLQTLQNLAHDGIGIMLIVHDLNLASLFCDRVVMLKDGHLIAAGDPENTFTEETLKHALHVELLVNKHPNINRPTLTPKL